jgi:hypothetical protein
MLEQMQGGAVSLMTVSALNGNSAMISAELEQQELKELYYEGGAGWLYDGEHAWQEEDAAVHIIAPYQVDLCDEMAQ